MEETTQFKQMTPDELMELLTKDTSLNGIAQEDWDGELDPIIGETLEVYRNREGYDKDCAVKVIHFIDQGYYIKFTGYYSSYEGSNYDEWKVVNPSEKTITVYE
mgnify:CR=1 FL=1